MLCAKCSAPLPPKRGRGKQRKFCETCRPPRRTRPTTASPEQPPVTTDASLVSSVESELTHAGRLRSALGQQALHLARRIATNDDTGSALASLHKELRMVMSQATADVVASADDVLDELAARRERRGA